MQTNHARTAEKWLRYIHEVVPLDTAEDTGEIGTGERKKLFSNDYLDLPLCINVFSHRKMTEAAIEDVKAEKIITDKRGDDDAIKGAQRFL